MRLTTKSRYGTRMILDIALNAHNKPVRLSEISRRQGISLKYLEKLVRELKKAGLVKSIRGPYGGYMLDRPTKDISVGDIVRVLEGSETIDQESLINTLNRIHFMDEYILVQLNHLKYEESILVRAFPRPCSGTKFTGLLSKKNIAGLDLADYILTHLIVDDGQIMIVFPAYDQKNEAPSWSHRSTLHTVVWFPENLCRFLP